MAGQNPTFGELLEQIDPDAQADGLKLGDVPQINVFHIYRKFGYGVHEYKYRIDPMVQVDKGNEQYLYPLFQNVFIYDRLKAFPILDVERSVLYLPKKINSVTIGGIPCPFYDSSASTISLTLLYKKEIPLSEQVSFFNDYFALLRHFFNTGAMKYHYKFKDRIDLMHYWLSSSPGVVTEVKEFSVDHLKGHTDLLIKSDMSTRIATQDSVIELLKLFSGFQEHFIDACKAHFINSVVKVTYGDTSKEYTIADITNNRSPDSLVFERNDLTYVEFFAQEYNIQIKNRLQPLLIHIEYVHERRKHVYTELIPELCRLVKIPRRGNELIDVEVDKPLAPIIRYQKLIKFFDLIYIDEGSKKALSDWGFSVERSVHTVLTDNLPPAWSHLLRGSLLDPVDLNNKWLIVYYKNDRYLVDTFLSRCQDFARKMSIKIDEPRKCGVNRRDTDTYLSAVKNHISQEDRIVVIVTPGSLQIQERYDAIKQWCTEVRAIPTQFVRSVTLEQPRKMDEICSNILVQMNCKVGGVPWSVDMPLENVMYVGIDVYKGFGANKQEITIMGFVASTNSNGTRWYSKVDQQPQNGICDETMGHAMKDALYMYKNKNRAFPRNIVIYRKEGNIQWTNVDRYEWLILYRNIQDVYQKEQVNNSNKNVKPDKYMPYIVLMTVARRISPGFSVEGVPTVFDDDDTLPVPIKNEQVREALSMRRKYRSKKSKENEETSSAGDTSSDYISADDEERRQRHEPFFLCTQNTKLSCLSPVFVRVLRQSGTPTGLKEDDDPEGGDPQVLSSKFLQKLSVKLCYLYYNIAAVCYQPSPILYSQKLAFFVGNHLKQEASENLDNVLFYL